MHLSESVRKQYTTEHLSAREAQRNAEFIAFGPIIFQVARIMVKWGILDMLRDKEMTINEIAETTGKTIYAIKCLMEASLSIGLVLINDVTDRFSISKTGWFLINDPATVVNMNFNHDVNYLGMFELEQADKLRGIVTQNVDGLHKAAGNIRVYELHGNVHENYCMECNASYPAEVILESDGIPRCRDCGGVIRPNVVLYGEALPKYVCIGAIREITNADTLIVAGTSLTVEPAASFLSHFRGKNLVVINRNPIPAEEQASLVLRGDVAEIMGQLH